MHSQQRSGGAACSRKRRSQSASARGSIAVGSSRITIGALAVWADDLIVNSTANLIAGKQILLEMIQQGRLRLRSHQRRPLRIATFGKVVVITGNEVSELIGETAEFKLFTSYMNVWMKRRRDWQLVAHHVGLIQRAEPEPPR